MIHKLANLVTSLTELPNALHACVEMARETSERHHETYREWLGRQAEARAQIELLKAENARLQSGIFGDAARELARLREFAKVREFDELPADMPEGTNVLWLDSDGWWGAPVDEFRTYKQKPKWRYTRLEDVPEVTT